MNRPRRVELPEHQVTPGNLYHVRFSDCCINGRFTARLLSIATDRWGELHTQWSNGLELNGSRLKFFVPNENDIDTYLGMMCEEKRDAT